MPNRGKKLKIDRLDKLEECVKVIEESVLKLYAKSLVELQKQLSEKTRLLSETNQKLLKIQEKLQMCHLQVYSQERFHYSSLLWPNRMLPRMSSYMDE